MRAYGYNRPLGMGTYPKGNGDISFPVVDVVTFDHKQRVEEVGRDCFGYVEYMYDVPTEWLERYELVTAAMYEESKPKTPPEGVMRKMAALYEAGDFDGLERMYDIAERKGYDMEATDALLGEMVA